MSSVSGSVATRSLAPDRTPGGARPLRRRRRCTLAVPEARRRRRGHPIGTLAELSTEELERLGAAASAALSYAAETETFVTDIVRALGDFDGTRAEQILAGAGRELSPRSLVIDVLGPLLNRIGQEWASGSSAPRASTWGRCSFEIGWER